MKTSSLWSQAVTADEMRRIERTAVESGAATGWAMMSAAGAGAADSIAARWPEPASALVLCGPGNNGGDGFVVATDLLRRGWRITLLLYGEPGRLKGDAATACARFREAGGTVTPWDAEALGRAVTGGAGLVVEALFGTGLSRSCDALLRDCDPIAERRRRAGAAALPTVTLDMPAGLATDSGKRLGERAFAADLCVTFHRPKLGHLLGEGPELIGELEVVSIGLAETPGPGTPLVQPAHLPPLGKSGGHKYEEGSVLVLAGPANAGGAARLAARGALRVGAGLVTVGAPAEALPEHAAQLTAIMLREVKDGGALSRRLKDDPRINAVCLGPGLGIDARGAELVEAALAADRPLVLDADALTMIAQRRLLMQRLHGGCVLTPHEGEFARLFPDIAERRRAEATFTRLDAARAAARQAGCTVLLKGPATVIAGPDGQAAINCALYARNAGWLATAGTGDVLAGLVAGLLARGAPPFAAAATAAWLHVEAALAFGPGLISEDLPDAIPAAFRRLGL